MFDHETALTRPGSALSAHDSGLTGIAPALDKGYMGRQVASGGMEPDLMDESQCDVEAVRSMLLSREGMSHAETASAPSRIVESGRDSSSCLSLQFLRRVLLAITKAGSWLDGLWVCYEFVLVTLSNGSKPASCWLRTLAC